MLRFLHSIFGGLEEARYPESLVREAIERAVDATDSSRAWYPITRTDFAPG